MKIRDITENTESKLTQVKSSDVETGGTSDIQDDVAAAVPDLVVFPKLVNTDPYQQYRFGLAMAAAKAEESGEINYEKESTYGEQMIVVSRGDEEADIIRLARKLYGADANYKHVTSKDSSETNDVNNVSPISPKGPIAHKSNG